jgi:hypothetical protein
MRKLIDLFSQANQSNPAGHLSFFLAKWGDGTLSMAVRFSDESRIVVLTKWDIMRPDQAARIIADIRTGKIPMQTVLNSPVRIVKNPIIEE